jgi:hypothetical protein
VARFSQQNQALLILSESLQFLNGPVRQTRQYPVPDLDGAGLQLIISRMELRSKPVAPSVKKLSRELPASSLLTAKLIIKA